MSTTVKVQDMKLKTSRICLLEYWSSLDLFWVTTDGDKGTGDLNLNRIVEEFKQCSLDSMLFFTF